MNLKDYGVVKEYETITFYINPANTPIMADIVDSQLSRIVPRDTEASAINDHRINNARYAFLILEAYILDMTFTSEHSLQVYWSRRSGLSIQQRWELFTRVVSSTDCNLLFEVYNDSRLQSVAEPETDGSKKKPRLTESVEPTPKDKTKQTA